MVKRNVCLILWPFPFYFVLILDRAWATPKPARIDLKFLLVAAYIYINGIKVLLNYFWQLFIFWATLNRHIWSFCSWSSPYATSVAKREGLWLDGEVRQALCWVRADGAHGDTRVGRELCLVHNGSWHLPWGQHPQEGLTRVRCVDYLNAKSCCLNYITYIFLLHVES